MLIINIKFKNETCITQFGNTLAQIPLAPKFAYLIALSNQENIMPFSITLVSILSVREPLSSIAEMRKDTAEETQKAMAEVLKQRRLWCSVGEARHLADLCVLLNILGAADNEQNVYFNNFNSNKFFIIQVTPIYLQKIGLRSKSYSEIKRLRKQLITVVNLSESVTEKLDINLKLLPPTQNQMRLLRFFWFFFKAYYFFREIITKSLLDQIAKRLDCTVDNSVVPKGAYKCQKLEVNFLFVFILFYKKNI